MKDKQGNYRKYQKSVIQCKESCQTTCGCTAFAFSPSSGMCKKYEGGPYTQVNENFENETQDYQCSVIKGILILFHTLAPKNFN